MDGSQSEPEGLDEHSPQFGAEAITPYVPVGLQSAAEDARRKRQELIRNYHQRLARMWRVAAVLFVATCFSTWLALGLTYSIAVMSILLAHEFGHYLQARRHGVPASPPFFIPFPISPIGTMGAVIAQAGGVANRKQMFDIAITGPLAGLAVAFPIAWYGIAHWDFSSVLPEGDNSRLGNPLILQWLMQSFHGQRNLSFELETNPLYFAGWVGIFITALNLMPIGQLDGGHILYCLIGRRAHACALLVVTGAVVYMAYTRDFGYAVMLMMILWMGTRHTRTADDRVPLGAFRVVLGWLTLGFVLFGFTPQPIFQLEVEPSQERIPNPLNQDE